MYGKKGSTIVQFSETKTFKGRGLKFKMEYINPYSSSFTIDIGKDITFNVTISKNESSKIHIDCNLLDN